jgi:hypothetical protein
MNLYNNTNLIQNNRCKETLTENGSYNGLGLRKMVKKGLIPLNSLKLISIGDTRGVCPCIPFLLNLWWLVMIWKSAQTHLGLQTIF